MTGWTCAQGERATGGIGRKGEKEAEIQAFCSLHSSTESPTEALALQITEAQQGDDIAVSHTGYS